MADILQIPAYLCRQTDLRIAAGWPVVFDATHSVQLTGGAGASSGGQPEFIGP